MSITDSWQDRERERKKLFRQHRTLSPAQQQALWGQHCRWLEAALVAHMRNGMTYGEAVKEMLKNPPQMLVWSERQPENWSGKP